ncbi:MAG: dicarboxylate/amino acid:cation symporter [Gemmatimonadaceae bacterium]
MTDVGAAGRRRPSPTVMALVALASGLALGVLASRTGGVLRTVVGVIEPVGALWVNAIRMTLVPLVVALLVTSVTGFADVRALGRLGVRVVFLFVVLLSGTALFAALTAPALIARTPIDPATVAALHAHQTASTEPVLELPTLRGFVVGLVPTNPIRAAAEGAMLPLIVFTLLFAIAVTQLPTERRALIAEFFRGVSEVMLTVVRWILRATPFGVFALSASMGAELGLGVLGPVAYYIVVLCGLVVAVGLVLYPVAAIVGRISLRRFALAAAPAQAMAVATRSSIASLPALIEGARRELGDRPGVTGFVLPLAVSTFKINTPISDLVGPLFLAHLYGVPLSPAQVATMTVVTIAMSFSNPGIPSGGLFVVTAPVMMSVGLPLDGIALLVAADTIPDIFNTVINVTGDSAVASMVARDAASG